MVGNLLILSEIFLSSTKRIDFSLKIFYGVDTLIKKTETRWARGIEPQKIQTGNIKNKKSRGIF